MVHGREHGAVDATSGALIGARGRRRHEHDHNGRVVQDTLQLLLELAQPEAAAGVAVEETDKAQLAEAELERTGKGCKDRRAEDEAVRARVLGGGGF